MSFADPAAWSLRLRVFLFFALIALGGAGLIAVCLSLAAGRIAPEGHPALVLFGGAAGLGVVVLTGWVWQLFDTHVARPIETLSGTFSSGLHGGGGRAIAEDEARYLGSLAPSAARLAEAAEAARAGAREEVAGAISQVLAEKARLEAILRDLREGVVICNARAEILLYNAEAQRLLGAREDVGLGRSLFALVTRQPVIHAVERLNRRFASGRYRTHRDHLGVALVCATRDGRRTLQGRVALVLDNPNGGEGAGVDGFVATFRDATAQIAGEAAREHLLKDALEALRRPAANLGAAVEILRAQEAEAGALADGTPGATGSSTGGNAEREATGHAVAPQAMPKAMPEAMTRAMRHRFMDVLAEESARLSRALDRFAESYDDLRVGGWSMNDVSTEALAACVADRLSGTGAGVAAPEIAHAGPRAWVHCDSYTVVELLARLLSDLGREGGIARVDLRAEATGAGGGDPHVFLDLLWQAPAPGDAGNAPGAVSDFWERDAWLEQALTPGLGTLSVRDVLSHHRTALWAETEGATTRLRLPLPPAVEDHESASAALPARPEFYDFSLLRRDVAPALEETRLDRLAVTVFDTETTGLFPSGGDEIVQIAGLRVLNGRVLSGEVFDRLVDPRRRIPAAATRIHGITDAMVAGQGDARTVLPAFHAFAEGSVLAAHNAPFDMKFLRLKEGACNVVFDQPVLDTVLLSAWLFGQAAEHTLDALAARFGVAVPLDRRHTALADTEVTAAVLCRMIPALRERGVTTLGQALEISERAGAIRRRQARY